MNHYAKAIGILQIVTGSEMSKIVYEVAKKNPKAFCDAYSSAFPDVVAVEPIWVRQGRELWPKGEQKIMAIKLIREKTGLGLKEAKDFVDGEYANPEKYGIKY